MKTVSEQEADDLLHEWAKSQHISLRRAGIIDDRRERTVRGREIPFSTIFATRSKRREQ